MQQIAQSVIEHPEHERRRSPQPASRKWQTHDARCELRRNRLAEMLQVDVAGQYDKATGDLSLGGLYDRDLAALDILNRRVLEDLHALPARRRSETEAILERVQMPRAHVVRS